jgi:hypothetical protein
MATASSRAMAHFEFLLDQPALMWGLLEKEIHLQRHDQRHGHSPCGSCSCFPAVGMAAWLPGSQGSHGTMVGPRAVSSGVISGLAKQDFQGLGDAQRLLEKTSRTTINQ